jgi:Bifunctional DNA primase/polymerase, N-terminal
MSAIPLHAAKKHPIPMGWQDYASALPSPELQDQWLNAHPNANIGLVLGAQSGVVVFDIDSVDEKIIDAILEVLAPYPSPLKRFGKKGMVLAYKSNGINTFRILLCPRYLTKEGPGEISCGENGGISTESIRSGPSLEYIRRALEVGNRRISAPSRQLRT